MGLEIDLFLHPDHLVINSFHRVFPDGRDVTFYPVPFFS